MTPCGPATLNLCFSPGDTFVLVIEFVDELGDPYDMTGWTYYAAWRSTKRRYEIEVPFLIDDTDALDGILTLSMDSTTSTPLDWSARWDLRRTSDSPPSVATLLAGSVSGGRAPSDCCGSNETVIMTVGPHLATVVATGNMGPPNVPSDETLDGGDAATLG